jgi:hypothetical protein
MDGVVTDTAGLHAADWQPSSTGCRRSLLVAVMFEPFDVEADYHDPHRQT